MSKTEDLGCLPNGAHLYRKKNEAGGWRYYSDEVGGGVVVWDTCLVQESTLLAALVCEHHRYYLEKLGERGWKPKGHTPNDEMAGLNGLHFLDPLSGEEKTDG